MANLTRNYLNVHKLWHLNKSLIFLNVLSILFSKVWLLSSQPSPRPIRGWSYITASPNYVTLALTLWALLLVSCFSLAAGIRMSQSASRMFPSYGVAFGKPTMVPLAWTRWEKVEFVSLEAVYSPSMFFFSFFNPVGPIVCFIRTSPVWQNHLSVLYVKLVPSTDQFVVLQLFGVNAVGVPDFSV